MRIKVRRLSAADHALLEAFTCGQRRIDAYLAQAPLLEAANLARVYLAFEAGQRDRVVGYYALHSSQITAEAMPIHESDRFRRGAVVGAMYVSMFAVHKDCQGQGIGTALFRDALLRIKRVSEEVGVWGVELDPLDARAARFYRRFGFETLDSRTGRLYLPVRKIA